ncbi:universal stress protein [Streptomyces nigra]|uniref:universal stress protein n=1 Tax=Streptomyces nigra TaxID=1827580 RepID=UPI0035DE5F15
MSENDGLPPIVVGVDPDPSRRAALTWAADEADRRALPLRLIHARGMASGAFRPEGTPPAVEEDEALESVGQRMIEEALAFVRSRWSSVEVSGSLAYGEPAWVLREAAADASMVVVGSWHLSARRELFSSASVALPLSAHAACPVAVVPEPEDAARPAAHFVVGVDGSRQSRAALGFAVEEAALRGAGVRALYAWHLPVLGALDEEAAVRDCGRVLSEAVAERKATHPEVEVHLEVVRGHPVQVLTEASEHALGLVVGTRGHGGFTGMLLGSVSQGVLHHARCPVVTVPG